MRDIAGLRYLDGAAPRWPMLDLPELQYWFSGTSLFLAGSFAFATVVSVAGLRDKISGKRFVGCLIAAACLSCFAWVVAARQERDSANLKQNIVRIADSLNINSNLSAKYLADEILKRLPPKYPLTDAEREQLASVLAATPVSERFAVDIYWPQLNGTRVYADMLAKVFTAHQWEATVKMAGLINGHGLTFAVSKKVADTDRTDARGSNSANGAFAAREHSVRCWRC